MILKGRKTQSLDKLSKQDLSKFQQNCKHSVFLRLILCFYHSHSILQTIRHAIERLSYLHIISDVPGSILGQGTGCLA